MAVIPGAAAILAHHAGWQDGETQKKRERGSSAWRGNVDGTLYLEKRKFDLVSGEAELTLITKKGRDIEIPPDLHCIRRRVYLNEQDRRGQPVSSCLIEPDRRTREDREAEAQASTDRQHQELDLRTLRVVQDHPDASSSQDKLRVRLGVKRDVAYGSLSRLLERGWIRDPERQRQPYTLTDTGRRMLTETTP
jgi:predicted transcriptional regulator